MNGFVRSLQRNSLMTLCTLPQDQYIEITTSTNSAATLYGLGERTSSTGLELRRDGIPLALWNRDSEASKPDQNVYGSHPILMEVRAGDIRALLSYSACVVYNPRRLA